MASPEENREITRSRNNGDLTLATAALGLAIALTWCQIIPKEIGLPIAACLSVLTLLKFRNAVRTL